MNILDGPSGSHSFGCRPVTIFEVDIDGERFYFSKQELSHLITVLKGEYDAETTIQGIWGKE